MSSLTDSLSRTLLLMRDEFGSAVTDQQLLEALTTTRIALVADAANLRSHSGQTAFITAALLMARSGHQVFLSAPNLPLCGQQPPLSQGGLIDQLMATGKNLLPGIEFTAGLPPDDVDLVIAFGSSPLPVNASHQVRLNAGSWAGEISRVDRQSTWYPTAWPFGGLAAGALGAGEAFKLAMLKLLPFALDRHRTASLFEPIEEILVELAPRNTATCRHIGEVDFISAGAITNATLYCLARIPGVRLTGRLFEPETADLSNLNRYTLLRRSSVDTPKAEDLAALLGDGLSLQAMPYRFERLRLATIQPLAPMVMAGVDHIPSRWLAQEAAPDWLTIGATTHWSAMASFHVRGLGCARCLHPEDDPDEALIPTTACVSFWAGLHVAAYMARRASGHAISSQEQQIYRTPFRPERPFRSPVAIRLDCPICQGSGPRHAAAA